MSYERHPIETIEGIGDAWGAKLRELEITATEDLLVLSETKLRSILKKIPQFPELKSRQFKTAAEFLLLDKLTGQQAEAFIDAGRGTLLKLSAPDPSALIEELEKAQEKGLIPKDEVIDQSQAVRWQKQAIKINHTGTIVGCVKNESDALEGAIVYCNNQEAVTDKEGKFYLPVAPYGTSKVVIRAQGYKRFSALVNIKPTSKNFNLSVELKAGEVESKEESEFDGKSIRKIQPEDKFKFIDKDINSIIADTPFILQSLKKDGTAKLNSAYRQRKGNEIQIARIYIPKEDLNEGASPGDIFIWTNGKFARTKQTLLDIRRSLFLKGKKIKKTRLV